MTWPIRSFATIGRATTDACRGSLGSSTYPIGKPERADKGIVFNYGENNSPVGPRRPGLGDRQVRPGNAAIGLEIALAGGVHDACRQRRRRRLAVPAAGLAFGVEI